MDEAEHRWDDATTTGMCPFCSTFYDSEHEATVAELLPEVQKLDARKYAQAATPLFKKCLVGALLLVGAHYFMEIGQGVPDSKLLQDFEVVEFARAAVVLAYFALFFFIVFSFAPAFWQLIILTFSFLLNRARRTPDQWEKSMAAREAAQKTTKHLRALADVDPKKTEVLDAPDTDWEKLVDLCIEATKNAERYCALEIHRIKSAPAHSSSPRSIREWIGLLLSRLLAFIRRRGVANGDQSSAFICIRADYVGPDRFHLLKEMWDGTRFLLDEWITIGKNTYQNAGLWFQVQESQKAQWTQAYGGLNESILVNNHLALLRDQRPEACSVVAYGGTWYAVLEYPQPRRDFDKCKAEIWFDLEHTLLTRVHLHAEREAEDGSCERVETTHVFAAYDEPIKVEPPAWLNAAPSGSGGHTTIVDNQIPKVLFYEEGGSVSAQD